jgi:hypothetical protein
MPLSAPNHPAEAGKVKDISPHAVWTLRATASRIAYTVLAFASFRA